MLNLFKLLGGPWEDVRQGLQDDLEHIEAAINQFYTQTFDRDGKLQTDMMGDVLLTNLPDLNASELLGRGSGSAGSPEPITVGANLLMSGRTLSATGGVTSTTLVAGYPGRDGRDGRSQLQITPAPTSYGTFGLTIDGAGAAITTGVKGFLSVPYDCTITSATLLSTDAAATAGNIVIDVWKDLYANYPPTVADTITASAKPTLSSASSSVDTTLTGWTKSIKAGDVLGFNVDSAATVTRVTLMLGVRR
jgi:hypothetical protein